MRKKLLGSERNSQTIIGSQDYSSKEISDIICSRINVNLSISNFRPPFTSDLELLRKECLAFLETQNPKIVWVAIGTPKQDFLAHSLSQNYAADYYCVGAAVSFLTGDISECPKWVSFIGLEWCYRFLLEPRRLWRRYLLGNVQFISILMLDLVNRIRHRGEYMIDENRNFRF
jgi:N-acetylglucosaminyldiphosphoundecaprenol N-acetyl-beta-D-mannosaminyltransferase